LCECKKHANPIKRETVQILHSRMLSVGAQKGIMVSTSSFQSGALEFANAHGIALVQVESGNFSYITNSISRRPPIPDDADDYVGFSETEINLTDIHYHVLKKKDCSFLDDYFEKSVCTVDAT